MEPFTGYARLKGERIYYQVLGDGPIDLVVNTGSWGSIDVEWDDPATRLFYQNVARFTRVIQFDRRGSGASDPIPLDALPPWESFVDELESVMDEVGSERAAVLGGIDGGPVSMLFAASQPGRVSALILLTTMARFLADDDYPFGVPPAEAEEYIRQYGESWGTSENAAQWAPSKVDDSAFLERLAKVQRSVYSPSAAEAYARALLATDARAILPAIRVPTLVLHVAASPVIPIEHGQYIADHINGAKFIELPGTDAAPFWEYPDLLVSAVEEFLTGTGPAPVADRRLSTVLFTDIVDSTRRAEELGDRSWRTLLDFHDEASRRLIEVHEGRLVKSTGDGVLATFDGPGRAISAAIDLQDELGKVQIDLRTGIHAGEIEVRGDDVSGIAVHLAARVMAEADPAEILVSRTVRDLVVGSDIAFSDRGTHQLKGIEGEWQLYSVVRPSPTR
ncbi:MAG: adenylate/guanylate cyclase domain-containing protein [Acidimicrobiia bacterium]